MPYDIDIVQIADDFERGNESELSWAKLHEWLQTAIAVDLVRFLFDLTWRFQRKLMYVSHPSPVPSVLSCSRQIMQ